VRQLLGISSFYEDRALETVYLEFYPNSTAQLTLLLDNKPAGRPQVVYANAGGYVYFDLPQRRNFIGRNFRTVQVLVQGSGYIGELGAELGDYYDGDRPLPPFPPVPPFPPIPPFPLPPGPINPIP
jgi:hypothetical protein